MQRRSVLLSFCGAISVAGCLTRSGRDEATSTESPDGRGDEPRSTESTDRRYEECSREIIRYNHLPAEIQTEIDAARTGRCEASQIYLREAMNVTRSYVAVADTYYDPTVTTDGKTDVLTLERVEPKALPNARPIGVEHHLDGERIITVEVVTGDGTVLISNELDLWPGGAVEFGHTARVGTHDCRITVTNDDQVMTNVTESIQVRESLGSVLFVVGSDDIRVDRVVADPPICQYDS